MTVSEVCKYIRTPDLGAPENIGNIGVRFSTGPFDPDYELASVYIADGVVYVELDLVEEEG